MKDSDKIYFSRKLESNPGPFDSEFNAFTTPQSRRASAKFDCNIQLLL